MNMMSEEEKGDLAMAIIEAERRGDMEEAERLLDMLPLPEWLAKCAFVHYGKDGLEQAKQSGLNFSEVEEKYGPQWYEHV
jgi:hypothetical protein